MNGKPFSLVFVCPVNDIEEAATMGNRPSVGKTVHNDAGNGLKVGTAEMKGWRDTMEVG